MTRHRYLMRIASQSAITLAACLFCALPGPVRGQPDEPDDYDDLPLIQREYFDRITLDERNRNEVYEVQRLDLPDGKAPQNPTALAGDLQFRRIEQPSLLFAVPWKHVVKVETFPQIVLADAVRLRDSGQLDSAFEIFAFLDDNYPDIDGLRQEFAAYLYLDIVELFKAKRYHETLAVLEELYTRNPQFKPRNQTTSLERALTQTLDAILQEYMEDDDFASVRGLLARIQTTYGETLKRIVDQWQGQLLEKATLSRDETRRHLAQNAGREAHRSVRHMLDILPTMDGGFELQAEVMNKFPLVMVGVSQPALVQDPRRIDNWAAKRVGHLTRHTLLEYASRGEEGGQYTSPLGPWELSEDGTQLSLDVSRVEGREGVPQTSAYAISRRLLSLADPQSQLFSAPWNRLVQSVRLVGVERVVVDLRFPHVLPEAFLRIPIEPPGGDPLLEADGIYVGGPPADGEAVYDRNPRYPDSGQSKRPKIVELFFGDASLASAALTKGEIDVIDRVFPADIARLRDDPSIVVAPYEFPTVHLLIPNPRSPYMENLNFRKALAYGINRPLILHNVLLANRAVEGCRTISGPFPAGVSDSDAFAYAYNERILPLPYEPTLAVALITAAEAELTKQAGGQPPQRPTLKIAYPVGDVAGIACEEIARHLQAVFMAMDAKNPIRCEAVQLPDGVTTDPEGVYDLLYVELSMWEPLVEARRLFETDDLIRIHTPYIDLALSQLDTAKNWSYARGRLYELHALSHYDAVVIPLYQILDHAAYRTAVTGIGERPLTLYQNARNWRIAPLRATSP